MGCPDINLRADFCIICKSSMHHFLTRVFGSYPGSPFVGEFPVDYMQCENCGFVISDTHRKMTTDQWVALNKSWHNHYENEVDEQLFNQPPYEQQALSLIIMRNNGIIDLESCLDYAAGYGSLFKVMIKYFDVELKIHDEYIKEQSLIEKYVELNGVSRYKTVINSAMFEHVLDRISLDRVNELVSDDGVLVLHTLICENIPKDPEWFYMDPLVHTAFHTNKSMNILMNQWGYEYSIYSPQSKFWFLFKKNYANIEKLEGKVKSVNLEFQKNYFFFKRGFVDYWKGF